MRTLIVASVLLAPAPAWAQRTELALLGGYTTSGDIENKAPSIRDLELSGSFTWGLSAGYFFTPSLGVEASWSRQGSDLVIGTAAGRAELFDVGVNLIQSAFTNFCLAEIIIRRLGLSSDAGRTDQRAAHP